MLTCHAEGPAASVVPSVVAEGRDHEKRFATAEMLELRNPDSWMKVHRPPACLVCSWIMVHRATLPALYVAG